MRLGGTQLIEQNRYDSNAPSKAVKGHVIGWTCGRRKAGLRINRCKAEFTHVILAYAVFLAEAKT